MSNVTIPLDWRPDPLGDDFQQAVLTARDGAQPTLVRYHPPSVESVTQPSVECREAVYRDHGAQPAILYVHGFSDYFFHPHVAEAFANAGYAFYAVELRGYGRAMDAHVANGGHPNMVDEIAVHSRDLDAAVKALHQLGHQQIIVLAHSLGGLIASMWAAHRPGLISALVLNSPWFDLNESWILRGPGTDAIAALATIAPNAVVGGLKPHYTKALHKATGGQWEFDTNWKPYAGFPVEAAWLTSVRRAQAQLAAGLDLQLPVLVLASTRTGSSKVWHPRLTTTDSVLNVEDIAWGAAQLGRDVTFVQITDGAHDLALSSTQQTRDEYLGAIIGWLQARL